MEVEQQVGDSQWKFTNNNNTERKRKLQNSNAESWQPGQAVFFKSIFLGLIQVLKVSSTSELPAN